MNTNFTEWKGDEEQAQPRPIAASKLSPTASAQVEPVPTDDRKAGSRRDQVHRKPFVWKLGHTLTANILQHSLSPNRNSHIPWNGLFIIPQLVKEKGFFSLALKHMILSSNKDFTKFMWSNFNCSMHCLQPCAGWGHLLVAQQAQCRPVFMGPLCLGSCAKAMSFY